MNRNQKIALGCGGGGCLVIALIVVVVGVLIAAGYVAAPGITSYTDTNSNSDSNSNSSRNSNFNSSNRNLNSNSTSNSNQSSSASEMTEDAKHRLYQAAGATKETDLMVRMLRKIGLGDGTGADHQEFIKAHIPWAMRNIQFVQSINTPEKARAYFDEHIDD